MPRRDRSPWGPAGHHHRDGFLVALRGVDHRFGISDIAMEITPGSLFAFDRRDEGIEPVAMSQAVAVFSPSSAVDSRRVRWMSVIFLPVTGDAVVAVCPSRWALMSLIVCSPASTGDSRMRL